MAQPIKIQKLEPQKQQPLVSQSIPVEFYKTYIPPAPPLKPVAPSGSNDDLTNFELPETTTITIKHEPKSLTGQYAASLPVSKLTTFKTISSISNKTDESKSTNDNKEKEEIDTETNTNSEKKTDHMTVGSYTCLQLMGGRHSIPKAVTSSAIAHSRVLRAGSEHASNLTTDASKNKKK